ncbi:MAG TPA: lytic transglycosylase domain-containing protein [Candidatus Sulfotelmatobacter sp.]|nr:lytic transglycosylase domain-containing protein [Candidatus Sulfotelmatobacter sp.]
MFRLCSYRRFGIVALVVAMALPCLADEIAVLKNGFSIRHARREVVGEITRLYVSKDGASFVDVPTAQLDHFEAAPELPAALAAASSSHTPAAAVPFASIPKDANASRVNVTPRLAARPKADISDVVNEASGRYRLDPDLVNSVIKAESGFNVRAVSPKGAQGLMQLMPGTASQLGVPNAFDAQANVEGGTKYLRELLEKYNFDIVKALAAYNAGPQRVQRFGGVPPYYETRAYVARIVRDFNKKKVAQQKAAATAAKKSSPSKVAVAKATAPAAKPEAKAVAKSSAPGK